MNDDTTPGSGNTPKKNSQTGLVWGLALGLVLGVALGLAFDNIGVFIGSGLAIGIVLGLLWDASQQRKNKGSE
jgi:uncharacterized membrane protein (UPF0136 family)